MVLGPAATDRQSYPESRTELLTGPLLTINNIPFGWQTMQSLSYPSYAFCILSLSEIHQAPGSPRAVVSLRGAPSYSLPWIDFYALLFPGSACKMVGQGTKSGTMEWQVWQLSVLRTCNYGNRLRKKRKSRWSSHFWQSSVFSGFVVHWNVCSKISYVEVLTPITSECDLVWKLCHCPYS